MIQWITDSQEKRKYIIDWWPAIAKWPEGKIQAHLPEIVAVPETVLEAQEAIKYAFDHHLAVVPFGGASGVLGGIVPEKPSLTIDMQKITGIVDFDEKNLLITVNAGLFGRELEDYLNERGYTTGHYPQSIDLATVGGLVATKSAGTFSSKYGNIEDMVQCLEVILPNGELYTNHNIPRSATGPHIPNLFIGSEGTLGLITKVTLKVRKIPERTEFRGIEFNSLQEAIQVARDFYLRDIVPAVIRIYNADEAQNLYNKIKRQSDKVLMIVGIVGAETVVPELLKQVLLTAEKRDGVDIGSEIGTRWEEHRYNADWLKEGNSEDTIIADAIEISANWRELAKIFEVVSGKLEGKVAKLWAHCSHFYPSGGNIYFIVFAEGKDREDTLNQFNEIWSIIMENVLAEGGSTAHHHGIGRQRLPWFKQEIGDSYDILKEIKTALDPEKVFNPGLLDL
ncbi:FAD-binding oxidoreductase [Carnobacterium gallinarum]|uniref:FAD-binding oxidoreductase n=1 Tax=Carnobacterium gallinarum TaxID=2749 RepID=UPI000553C47C|nr:FAD-binding oxidoreductase [Carnobacterium gallinarum]